MPKSRQSASDDDDLAIRIVALLKEDKVATQMKALFHPKELLAVISSLTAKVDHLTSQLALKDARIDGLEQRLAKLEIDSDSQEQYSRRPNLRIQGLPEQGDGTTDDKVLFVINDTMGLTPPLVLTDIERSHRLGPKTDREGRPRTRVTIVRFRSERVRDTFFSGPDRYKEPRQTAQRRPDLLLRRPDGTEGFDGVRNPKAETAEDSRLLDRHPPPVRFSSRT